MTHLGIRLDHWASQVSSDHECWEPVSSVGWMTGAKLAGGRVQSMSAHSLVMSPDRARGALAGLRFGLAAGSWLTPRTTGRLFGLQPDANPVSPYLARLFGARAAWLGTEILLAESGAARRQLIRRHMAIDVVDLAATLMGWQRGYLNRRGALLTRLGAVTAIGLALRASNADPDGSP